MKVLFILPTFSRKGAGVMEAPKGLALALNSHFNIEISAIALDDEYTNECLKEWEPINIYRRKNYFAGFSFGLSALLDEIKPDIIHIHGLWVGIGIQSAFWAIKKKTPYVVSPHGMMDEWAWKKSRIKKVFIYALLQKKVIKRAHALHALNREEAESIHNITEQENIFIQPNGINLSYYIKGGDVSGGLKKLLYLGRLDQKKSVLELVKVWKSLVSESDDFNWELEIAGSGLINYEKQLKEVAKSIPSKFISFKGHVSGMSKYKSFKTADAFILPSKSEGLPVSILEAWAASLPVAMTKECNLNEALNAGFAFEVYPDFDRLKNSLKRFLSLDKNTMLNMGSAAHSFAKQKYSWKNIAEEFETIYTKINA